MAAVVWTLYVGLFVWNWLRVRRWRRERGERREGRTTDPGSMRGLVLQGVGLACAAIPVGSSRGVAEVLALLSLTAGLLLAWAALTHLGDQWRVNAVVTEDHRLVTSGPYRVVRHPIYTSLLAMVAGTGLLVTSWVLLAAALLFYAAGTEIRVRSEDALLASHFGAEHEAWRRRTKTWIPWVH
ncbi:MAG: isoprenylcysteine carboxylmethyltransferase family protein [Bryobacteraceae bacterium]|nr:isoprenylcysteine carboxylmethyltransferase family protein [Bryobacteraceae bacterium]